MLKYRPDIDGLRAVAVVSVLMFHVGIAAFPGGFVGVDVFFVISGYLISLVIHQHVIAGTFSLLEFYERRIRRILPAFIAAISFTALLSYLYLMPSELRNFTGSLTAALLSASNVYFWLHSGYFEAPAASEPLLQTWSLAVEEQFYLVFPLLLMGLQAMRGRPFRPVLLGLAALSFAVSALSVRAYPETTFYLLHTRAWELLLGSIVALRLVPELGTPVARNAASVLGIGLIAYPIFFYNSGTAFPGPAALPPCLGAALVIAAGRTGPSLAGRVLSLRPIVFIGLISYSLYLWHWPIVVFQRSDAFLIEASPRIGKAVMIAASLVAGTLSWWFIERPFRRPGFLSRAQVYAGAGAGALLVCAEAAMLLVAPSRYSPEFAAIAAFANDPASHFRTGTCFLSTRETLGDFDRGACLQPVDGRKNYLLIGDSHAAHLWYGLSQAGPGMNVMQATASGCKPTLADAKGYGLCAGVMSIAFDELLATQRVDKVLLAARWSAADMPALAATLDWLHGRGIPVAVFGPTPQYDAAFPRILAQSIERRDPGLPGRHMLEEGTLDRQMAALVPARSAAYISLLDVLCPARRCLQMTPSRIPLQFDYSHFTRDGSAAVAQLLVQDRLLP